MNARTLLFALLISASTAACATSFTAGIHVADEISASETGLAAYPGATPVESRNGESESAKVQMGFGEYGLKVVVAKLRTSDAPDKVADFYRKDLARYGAVLDCSNAPPTEKRRDRKSKALTCDDVHIKGKDFSFKSGVKDDQYLVEIKRKGDFTEFALVHLRIKGIDWD